VRFLRKLFSQKSAQQGSKMQDPALRISSPIAFTRSKNSFEARFFSKAALIMAAKRKRASTKYLTVRKDAFVQRENPSFKGGSRRFVQHAKHTTEERNCYDIVPANYYLTFCTTSCVLISATENTYTEIVALRFSR
jgi:hypothetical protein